MGSDRQKLRRDILCARDEISQIDRVRKSRVICEKLWMIEAFLGAETVFTYVNFRSEVDTGGVIRQCLDAGKRVAVPLTDVGRKEIIPFQIQDPFLDLRPGYCGIPEPDPSRTQRLEPSAIQAVIVPGSVFDVHGGRLGYGGGYYDRFLAVASCARRIGIAFEKQVVEAVPLLPHDQLMDFVVTEKRIISISEQGRGPDE